MEPLGILALQNIPRIGDKTLNNILSLPNSTDPASPHDLYKIIKEAKLKFNKIPLPDFNTVEKGWAKAIEILEKSKENDVKIIGKNSPYYPSLLLKTDNPPELLHVKGNIDILNDNSIAIVGTRKPTEYGICQAINSGERFAEQNYVIVSGLAKGIDTAAHEGALNVRGKTIAVLAHGLHTIYPKENKKLAEGILDKDGVLISEYFWGKKSTKGSFVARDRIQSGLSLSVLVIETKEKGGTMHTVNYCNEQGRLLIVLETPKDLNYIQHYTGNLKLINEKLADFVLRCDFESLKCSILLNQCEDNTSNSDLENKYVNNIGCLHSTKIKIEDSKIQNFYNYILNYSFPYKLECSKMNNEKSFRDYDIPRKCLKCENFDECKLIEQGFIELCPFDRNDIDFSNSRKEVNHYYKKLRSQNIQDFF